MKRMLLTIVFALEVTLPLSQVRAESQIDYHPYWADGEAARDEREAKQRHVGSKLTTSQTTPDAESRAQLRGQILKCVGGLLENDAAGASAVSAADGFLTRFKLSASLDEKRRVVSECKAYRPRKVGSKAPRSELMSKAGIMQNAKALQLLIDPKASCEAYLNEQLPELYQRYESDESSSPNDTRR